jgi:putative hemolysin
LVLGSCYLKELTKPSEAIAKKVAMPMKFVSIVTAPFIWLLTFNRVLLNILKINLPLTVKVTEEEIKAII